MIESLEVRLKDREEIFQADSHRLNEHNSSHFIRNSFHPRIDRGECKLMSAFRNNKARASNIDM